MGKKYSHENKIHPGFRLLAARNLSVVSHPLPGSQLSLEGAGRASSGCLPFGGIPPSNDSPE